MFKAIQRLRDKGYTPATILDVGCNKCNWTELCNFIYPNAKYYLFDATYYDEMKQHKNVYVELLYKEPNVTVQWYSNKSTGDSIYKENTKHYKNIQAANRITNTLDNILYNKNLSNIFMKIDVQGSEVDILDGSTKLLSHVDFIIMEVPLFGKYNDSPYDFTQYINILDTMGFSPYEVVENHCIKGFNIQLDMLFINKNHYFNKLVQDELMK